MVACGFFFPVKESTAVNPLCKEGGGGYAVVEYRACPVPRPVQPKTICVLKPSSSAICRPGEIVNFVGGGGKGGVYLEGRFSMFFFPSGASHKSK